MADRKKKHAYLDDFEKDLNGNYQYRGAQYRYKGETPRRRMLIQLWLLCGGGAALTLGAGALPGATARAEVWLLLPYMAALVVSLYAVVVLARMTRGGDPMRAYIHEQTVQRLPAMCTAAAVLCGFATAAQAITVFAQGVQLFWGMQGIFILFEAVSCGAFTAAARLTRRIKWEKQE